MNTNQLELNKKIAISLSTAIMEGAWDMVETLISDDFVYIGDGKDPINKQEYIGFMKNILCIAMHDMKMEFPRVIAENDLVAVEYTNEMTHSGVFYGVPATNRRVIGTGHFIRKIIGGKVTAEWQTTNAMGLISQLRD
jgi:predicted ester cyclase